MFCSNDEMYGKESGLMLRKEALLHITLTNESIAHGKINLCHDENFESGLCSKMTNIFSLLSIIIGMQEKLRPSLFDFIKEWIERTSDLMKIEFIVQFLLDKLGAFSIKIHCDIFSEKVCELCCWTTIAFTSETIFRFNRTYHSIDQIIDSKFLSSWSKRPLPYSLVVFVPWLQEKFKISINEMVISLHTFNNSCIFSWYMHMHVSWGETILTFCGLR